MMRAGRAIGGPLDAVKVEAGHFWNGVLEKHPGGRYEWDGERATWVWQRREAEETVKHA